MGTTGKTVWRRRPRAAFTLAPETLARLEELRAATGLPSSQIVDRAVLLYAAAMLGPARPGLSGAGQPPALLATQPGSE